MGTVGESKAILYSLSSMDGDLNDERNRTKNMFRWHYKMTLSNLTVPYISSHLLPNADEQEWSVVVDI
jgi:hypothetical protein